VTPCIAAACRSAVAPRGGALAKLELHELAAPVLTAALELAGIDPADVDELILSNALGAGGNPARSAALAAGLPERVAGLTIDRQCAGGLDALLLARAMILAGDARIVLAGGVESYSRRPIRSRRFADGRAPEPYEQAPFTPWPDRDPDMTHAAHALALKCGICRAEQDEWARESHRKAMASPPGRAEVTPVGGLTKDPFARALSPALCDRAKTLQGSITSANTAVAADASAFCVVVSADVARALGGNFPRIISGATLGGQPDLPGLAPVAAIASAMDRAGMELKDMGSAEIMEAYAVQAIACQRGAGFDPAIVNRSGGALARGHPIGASGAVNAVRLYHEVLGDGRAGVAAIAAAGGIGTALVLAA